MSQCGIPAVIIIVVIALSIYAGAMQNLAAAEEHDKAHIIYMATMQGCKPCEDLKALLKRRGIKQGNPVIVHEAPPMPERDESGEPMGFPAVCYDLNGRAVWDTGKRIREGRYYMPEKPIARAHFIQ